LGDGDEPVNVQLAPNQARFAFGNIELVTKVVDGKFPDYTKVLPKPAGRSLVAARSELRDSLSRASILSNEKFRGVRLVIDQGGIQILASNQEQEEAEESIAVDYDGDRVEIGFNVSYLIDVLGALSGESVRIQFSDGSSSVLMEDPAAEGALYVVMPMRL